MRQFNVTGMSCAACSARVEKAVSEVTGVTSCSVNLLTNSMGVEGTATDDEIINAVTEAGYGATPKKTAKSQRSNSKDDLKDTETPVLIKRLISSIIFIIPLLYVTMGHMLLGFPLPHFLHNNPVGVGILELILSSIIMVINQKFFINGFRGIIHKSPNMDTLVALGATAAFIYSTVYLFVMTLASSKGDFELANSYMSEFYFESSAMILVLITVGKTLEAKSKGKTTDSIKSLMDLAPKTACLIRDGKEVIVPIDEVNVGDIYVVKPGESIPVDGIVVEGISSVNESALTGESIPVDKEINSEVSAATINTSGHLKCKATRVGEDTTLSQIIQMVSDASATKAPIARIADKISGIFVPTVIGIAIVTFVVWLIAGKDIGFSLSRSISVLVISCPCALGLATPVAIMVGNGISAKNGILFKTSATLEESGRLQIIALDKTGTITKGEPEVRVIIPNDDVSENELLALAYSLEVLSEHPLAKAIVEKAQSLNITNQKATDFKVEVGNGLSAFISGKKVFGGKKEYISKITNIPVSQLDKTVEYTKMGYTPLFFATEKEFLGTIFVSDVIKEDSRSAIKEIKDLGIHVVMLTGDNEATAKTIGTEVGVDEVVANVLPDGKEEVIKELQKHGKVAMVGDGINDAPALTSADIGIAIGAGTDVAIESANIVLMKSNLSDVVAAIKISRATLRIIKQNLFWAFFYNLCGIPLAAGVWFPLFGWTLSPIFGAAAMGLSSFCVVSNALRLNLFKPYDNRNNKALRNSVGHEPLLNEYIKNKGDKNMEINVKGMMCGHCEAHVKKALEAIDGIETAIPNHTTGIVSIKTSKEVDIAVIKAAIEAEGYEFVG